MSCARNELERLGHAHTASLQPRPSQPQYKQPPATATTATNDGCGTIGDAAAVAQPSPDYRFKMAPQPNNDDNMYEGLLPQEELPQLVRDPHSPNPADEKILTVRRKPSDHKNYDWVPLLNSDPNVVAADVTCFPHAPGCDTWYNIGIGMKVEVENTDCDTAHAPSGGGNAGALTPHSFWVASVMRICGYKALMRYEGFGEDASRDFWVNLCSSEVHPVGWCATRGKPLIAPSSLSHQFSDWKEFLVNHLSGARTLPTSFYNRMRDSFKSRFRIGLQLEVIDKSRISHVKLASVQKIVGKRLLIKYFDQMPDDVGFWCHEDSALIHPVGWASTVGHALSAPMEYLHRMLGGPEQMIEACPDDSIIDLFRMNFTFEEYYMEDRPKSFETGMRLEAVDPLNLSSICVATVTAVLKFGYLMVRIDSYELAEGFCFHERSPYIFWPGFCAEYGITVAPPIDHLSGDFIWNEYLTRTGTVPADRSLFWREMPPAASNFSVGMKIECADLMDPRLVCAATIGMVLGRLLKVQFDGWEDEYDQYLDCESPDMYPVGWCVLVGHSLEGPKPVSKPPATVGSKATGKSKAIGAVSAAAKTPRKRKKKAPLPKPPAQVTGELI